MIDTRFCNLKLSAFAKSLIPQKYYPTWKVKHAFRIFVLTFVIVINPQIQHTITFVISRDCLQYRNKVKESLTNIPVIPHSPSKIKDSKLHRLPLLFCLYRYFSPQMSSISVQFQNLNCE
jgi:hypothetical protein